MASDWTNIVLRVGSAGPDRSEKLPDGQSLDSNLQPAVGLFTSKLQALKDCNISDTEKKTACKYFDVCRREKRFESVSNWNTPGRVLQRQEAPETFQCQVLTLQRKAVKRLDQKKPELHAGKRSLDQFLHFKPGRRKVSHREENVPKSFIYQAVNIHTVKKTDSDQQMETIFNVKQSKRLKYKRTDCFSHCTLTS